MTTTEPTLSVIPPHWLSEFCHLSVVDDGYECLCGYIAPPGPLCDSVYDGEAICPSCGYPTCPRCAIIDHLEQQLLE